MNWRTAISCWAVLYLVAIGVFHMSCFQSTDHFLNTSECLLWGLSLLGAGIVAFVSWIYRKWWTPYRVKTRVFPCLRYPFTFENYTEPEFRKNNICVDLRQRNNILNPLKKYFRIGEAFSLVICVANDNGGIPLKNVRLRVEFEPTVAIHPGRDWGDDGQNSYIFNFHAETIAKSFAINASELTIRASSSGFVKVKYTIGADEIDGPISGHFFIQLGTQEELFPMQSSGAVYYTTSTSPVASASSAYKPSNDWMIRDTRDANGHATNPDRHEQSIS